MKRSNAPTDVTMREFRAAPAKLLGRAARTKTRLRIGNYVIAVEETGEPAEVEPRHGCMRQTGRILGDPARLLSAEDRWATDA